MKSFTVEIKSSQILNYMIKLLRIIIKKINCYQFNHTHTKLFQTKVHNLNHYFKYVLTN